MKPEDIITLIGAFMPMFSEKVWLKVEILLIGAILCRGGRTVSSILRVMGLKDEENFCNYHRVLNRVKWSGLMGGKILLGLLISIIPELWPLIILVDETIERRKGKKIKSKGVYRDGVKSTKKCVVKCFGLKWISMMLLLPLPWSSKCCALPFLTVLSPSETANTNECKRHKTTIDWTIQMIKQVRRWERKRELYLVGDGAYSCVNLGLECVKNNISLVSRLRLDSNLYDFPPLPEPHKRGRKPLKGKSLPKLEILAKDRSQKWKSGTLVWYGQTFKTVNYLSGVCLWYRASLQPLPIQWVLISDPEGKSRTEAFFSTNLTIDSLRIAQLFIWRWPIETTFQECRNHLGFETQRQWSDKAIQRTSPVILALFSIVCLMALKLYREEKLLPLTSVWYNKKESTFSDLLIFVRKYLWNLIYLNKSDVETDFIKFDSQQWQGFIEQLAQVA
jgi:hypothetical protein